MRPGEKQSLIQLYPFRIDILITIALATFFLVQGLKLPILTIKKIWIENTFSILSGISNLRQDGHYFLALIIFFFSIIFPITKLVTLLFIWLIPLSDKSRKIILYWLEILGRWSMLDVFVAAVIVVSVKLGALASAQMRSGVYYFGIAILLSMWTTFMINYLVKRKADE